MLHGECGGGGDAQGDAQTQTNLQAPRYLIKIHVQFEFWFSSVWLLQTTKINPGPTRTRSEWSLFTDTEMAHQLELNCLRLTELNSLPFSGVGLPFSQDSKDRNWHVLSGTGSHFHLKPTLTVGFLSFQWTSFPWERSQRKAGAAPPHFWLLTLSHQATGTTSRTSLAISFYKSRSSLTWTTRWEQPLKTRVSCAGPLTKTFQHLPALYKDQNLCSTTDHPPSNGMPIILRFLWTASHSIASVDFKLTR